MIDLSSNENPYEPSPLVLEALNKHSYHINRYLGYQELDELKNLLAHYAKVSKESIFIGPGTNALLQEIIFAFAKGRNIITLNPCFFTAIEKGKSIADKVLKIQLRPPEFKLQLKHVPNQNTLFILDSPNNPTGQCLINIEDLVTLLKNSNNLVVIDEAYFEYSKKSFVNRIATYPNFAIIRTLDKAFALASLKVSYLIAGDYFIKGLKNFDLTINRPAFVASIAVLKNQEYMTEHVNLTIKERNRLKELLILNNFEVENSDTNFLLVKTSIPEFDLRLREKNIIINNLSNVWLPGYYTISVGTRQENDFLINALNTLQR